MKVLLAIDESPHSQAATDEVCRGQWARRAMLRVLSVVRPVGPVATELWSGPPVDLDRWEADIEKSTRELAMGVVERLIEEGFDADASIRHGDPRTAIVDEANEWSADLIVVGSHGYTGLRRILLGSVAQYVVSHAKCSVLVVRQKLE